MRKLLEELIRAIDPDVLLIPFRYDRHPDHLAVNHVVMDAHREAGYRAQRIEYFVYYRWRLLPAGDIRTYVQPETLIAVDISGVSKQKRIALDYFKTQTTRYYPWQTRPILTPQLLDEETSHQELFLVHNPEIPGAAVFTQYRLWIRLAHRLEPFLQRSRYKVGAILKRISS